MRLFYAGALGIEPRPTVLETDMIPFHHAPILTAILMDNSIFIANFQIKNRALPGIYLKYKQFYLMLKT